MNGVIRTVGEVQMLAERLGMTEVVLVRGLHGRWHLPGVDLVVQLQWAHLVITVIALPDDDLLGRDGYEARFSADTPVDVVRWHVGQAKRPQLSASA